MKLVYDGATLADDADMAMVPSRLAINCRQVSIDSSARVGAETMVFYGRGNRQVDVSLQVDYGFATMEEASEYALTHWAALADQADLVLTFGTSSWLLADAVLTGPQVVPGSLTEAACLIQWSCVGGKFTGTSGDSTVASILTLQSLTPSAAGNTTITLSTARRISTLLVYPAAGSGSYTHKIVLPATGRQEGDLVKARVEMPASANPTIEFRDASSSGTTLRSLAPMDDGAGSYLARTIVCSFVFNGTAWVPLSSNDET